MLDNNLKTTYFLDIKNLFKPNGQAVLIFGGGLIGTSRH